MKTIEYNIIKCEKFKQVAIDVRFLIPKEKEMVTKISLLSLIFNDRCEKYNTKTRMNAVLDELYGASLTSKVVSVGSAECLNVSYGFINEKYASRGQFRRALQFLKEVLMSPLINEDTLREAKNVLKDVIMRKMDTPKEYARQRVYEIAGQNQPIAIPTEGYVDDIDSISVDDMKKVHRYVLDNANIMFTCAGDIKKASFRKKLISLFGEEKRGDYYPTNYYFKNNVCQTSETKNTDQSQISIIYQTEKCGSDPDFWAYRIGCVLLGQLPVSLLFTEVREKRSLCYSISSTNLGSVGAMVISTGVDSSKIDEAVDVTLQQVRRMTTGDFDDQLIEICKTMLINAYHSNLDDLGQIINNFISNKINGISENEKEFVRKVKAVKKKDIIDAYARISEPTVFVLKGEKNGKNS